MTSSESFGERIEAMMTRVEAMERGGDLEGLLEEECGDIRRLLYQEALRRRQAAAKPADFPPSDMPALPGANHASTPMSGPAHRKNARR